MYGMKRNAAVETVVSASSCNDNVVGVFDHERDGTETTQALYTFCTSRTSKLWTLQVVPAYLVRSHKTVQLVVKWKTTIRGSKCAVVRCGRGCFFFVHTPKCPR